MRALAKSQSGSIWATNPRCPCWSNCTRVFEVQRAASGAGSRRCRSWCSKTQDDSLLVSPKSSEQRLLCVSPDCNLPSMSCVDKLALTCLFLGRMFEVLVSNPSALERPPVWESRSLRLSDGQLKASRVVSPAGMLDTVVILN